jgi:hypothetical protein
MPAIRLCMPRYRDPGWPRGRPRFQPQRVRADVSDTADVDVPGTRTVDPTWDPTAARSATTSFEPLQDRSATRRSWRPSAGWASAIIAALIVIGGSILYVAGIRADVTLVTERVKDLREDFKKLDDRLHDFIQGKRQPDVPAAPTPSPKKR